VVSRGLHELRAAHSSCIPRRSTFAAILLGLALFPGCARQSDGTANPSATAVSNRPAASALASAQPLPSAVANVLPPAHPLDLAFEIAPDPASGAQTLWGTIASLGIRQSIGRAAPPLVCGVASQPPGASPSRRRSRATIADCGNENEVLAIRVEGETLRLGPAEFKVPARSFIVHEELAQPLPPERDCSKAGKTLVSVSIKHDATGLQLAIPALHQTRLLTELEAGRSLYCRTTVLKLARRMDVLCSTGQLTSTSFHLAVKRDVLFVETRSVAEIDDFVSRRQLGYELPCNADLRFDGINYRSPNYAPSPDHCATECWIKQNDCERRCAEQFSDDQGTLTAPGEACKERCNRQNEACGGSCKR
jgi:hypothetical protein